MSDDEVDVPHWYNEEYLKFLEGILKDEDAINDEYEALEKKKRKIWEAIQDLSR